MWRENYFCCARASTTEYNKVAWGWPNEYNIIQHCGKQKKCCIVQHLFSEKFDRDQTSYNTIRHDKTRYNKVAKRVQHFIKHLSCMMLYEMLYSFGRGLNVGSIVRCWQSFSSENGTLQMINRQTTPDLKYSP